MSPEQIRQNRISVLRKYYIHNGYNDSMMISKAKSYGVSEATAKSYLNTIKAQLHK